VNIYLSTDLETAINFLIGPPQFLAPALAEVAGVTYRLRSCSKFLNPGLAIFQIWESDSGYNHHSNRNLPMFLLKKWPHRLLPKWKSDSGSGFSQISDSGSERKTQNPAGVDSGSGATSGPWL